MKSINVILFVVLTATFMASCGSNSTSSDDPTGEKFWNSLSGAEKNKVGVDGYYPNQLFVVEVNERTSDNNWLEYDLEKIKEYLQSIDGVDLSNIRIDNAEDIESPQGKGLKAVFSAPNQPTCYLVYNIDESNEGFAAIEEVTGFDKLCSDFDAVGTEGAVKMMIMTTVLKNAFHIFKTTNLEKDGKIYRILGIFTESNH